MTPQVRNSTNSATLHLDTVIRFCNTKIEEFYSPSDQLSQNNTMEICRFILLCLLLSSSLLLNLGLFLSRCGRNFSFWDSTSLPGWRSTWIDMQSNRCAPKIRVYCIPWECRLVTSPGRAVSGLLTINTSTITFSRLSGQGSSLCCVFQVI